MRVIVAGPPKTGNTWIKHLLAEIYRLEVLGEGPPADEASLRAYIESGQFKDQTIFNQHYYPTASLSQIVRNANIQLVTTIRNPYDVFVSLFFFTQNFPELFGPEHNLHFMVGKPIDHPDVLAFIGDKNSPIGFGYHIDMALRWLEHPKTIIISYENLHTHTFQELLRVTHQIALPNLVRIPLAMYRCSADQMRKQTKVFERHIRKATVGDFRNHLTQAHYKIFRAQYGDELQRLGYSVI